MKNRLILSAYLIALTAAYAAPAFAQSNDSGEESRSTPPESNTEYTEEIVVTGVVTGSSIRGEAPVGSDLITLDRSTIDTQAPANTSELLAAIPQLGNFATNHEQATQGRFRTPGFQANIHNLGTGATLTLFNGHRFAPVGGEGVVPDSAIIPVIAIERVEVIADGASAVYGSDAVAGVVNFIYRKKFDGIMASGTYGLSADNPLRKYNAGLLAGTNWDSGNAMFAYEFSKNESPLNRDIDYIRMDQTFRGGNDFRSASCAQPNVRIGGSTYGSTGVTGDPLTTNLNRCESLLDWAVIPDGRRHSFLVTAEQELGDIVTLWSEFNYSDYETKGSSYPRSFNIEIPTTSPNYRDFPGATATTPCQTVAGTCEILSRGNAGLFPNPVSIQSSQVFGVTAGVDIKLGGDWLATIMAHYSRTRDYNDDPAFDNAAAQRLAISGELNVYGQAADNDPSVLAQIDNGFSQINLGRQALYAIQARADGTIFTIPGGDVKAAIGVDFRDEQLHQFQSSGAPGVNYIEIRDDHLNRADVAAFGELLFPLVGPENSISGVNELDLSVSGRYDHYQIYGGTFNPKIGVNYKPIPSVTLRGSYGTSFVAPNVGLLTTPFANPNIGSNIQGSTVNIVTLGGGNPNVTPEDATTRSLGFDFMPESLPDFRFSATYYYVKYSNLLFKPSTNDVLFNPAFADLATGVLPFCGTCVLTPEEVAARLGDLKSTVELPTTIHYIVDTTVVNVGTRIVDGMDFGAEYTFDLGERGSIILDLNANLQSTNKQKLLDDDPFVERADTQDAVRWKGRASATWLKDAYRLSLVDNYVGPYDFTQTFPVQRVDSWHSFDLVFSYTFDDLLGGTQLQLRAQNVFDEESPFVKSFWGYSPALANPFGRILEATFRVQF